ncbi:hypothetical protein KEM55_002917, partial [Ascosphaera atra]
HSPACGPRARGVSEIITSAEQAFQALGPVLHGVGLRLAYLDDPSSAQDPDPPFEEKLRLMVRWAREMDRYPAVPVGLPSKRVQEQIAADPRVTANDDADAFAPSLPAHQRSAPAVPQSRPIRAKRERPLSFLSSTEPTPRSPSSRRPRRKATKPTIMSESSSSTSPSLPEYQDESDVSGEEEQGDTGSTSKEDAAVEPSAPASVNRPEENAPGEDSLLRDQAARADQL